MRGWLTETKALLAPKPLITENTTLTIVGVAGVGPTPVGVISLAEACSSSGLRLGSVEERPAVALFTDGNVRVATRRGGSEPRAVSTVLRFEAGEGAGDGAEGQGEKHGNLHRGDGS